MKHLVTIILCSLWTMQAVATQAPQAHSASSAISPSPLVQKDANISPSVEIEEAASKEALSDSLNSSGSSPEPNTTAPLEITKRQAKKLTRLSKHLKKSQEKGASLGKQLLVAGLIVSMLGLLFMLLGLAVFAPGLLIAGYTLLGIGSVLLIAAVLIPLLQNMD